jgi:hypothetical protein
MNVLEMKSLVQSINNNGSSIVPCETPKCMSFKVILNQLYAVSVIPYKKNLFNKMLFQWFQLPNFFLSNSSFIGFNDVQHERLFNFATIYMEVTIEIFGFHLVVIWILSELKNWSYPLTTELSKSFKKKSTKIFHWPKKSVPISYFNTWLSCKNYW